MGLKWVILGGLTSLTSVSTAVNGVNNGTLPSGVLMSI